MLAGDALNGTTNHVTEFMKILETHRTAITCAAKLLLPLMIAVELYFSLRTFEDVTAIAQYDKLLHFSMHAANAVVAALAFPAVRAYVIVLLLLFLLGPLIELLQHFTPGRDASILDQLANTAGLLTAAWLSRRLLAGKPEEQRGTLD